MKLSIAIIMALAGCSLASANDPAPLQQADCGRIERSRVFSPQLKDTITVDIWLPEDYSENQSERYPVIYMHDGQNLFDASTTWNHQSWEMDRAMCSLIKADKIKPAIIVGVHSSPTTRVADLMPEKAVTGTPLEAVLEEVKLKGMTPRGDAYAAFLVKTLKPIVDKTYRTEPDIRHTTVMGSSMGGLMSIYSLCEYPDVFGNAVCMSTHWTGAPAVAKEFEDAMYDYIDENLPSPANHRLYFDHGTETIDSGYGPAEERILGMIRTKGYSAADGTLYNMVDQGAAHEERAWAARVSLPLIFILANPK